MTRRSALQLTGGAAFAQPPAVAAHGSRLLLDSRLVAKTRNLELKIAPSEKVSAPLTIDGKSVWCPNNLYTSIWREPDGEFRGVWGEHMNEEIDNLGAGHLMRSRDGLAWETYGEWVMWPGAMFRDEREKDPNRRYKSIFRPQVFTGLKGNPKGNKPTLAPVGMFGASSADGQLWTQFYPILMIRMEPGVRFWRVGTPYWVGGDNNPCGLWAPSLGRYVALFRDSIESGPGKRRERAVGLSTSEDFEHWSAHELVLRADPYGVKAHGLPMHDIHGMQAFYAGGVYLGLLEPYYWDEDRMHMELASSPDMRRWDRVCPGTELVPHPAVGQPDGGCRFAGCGVVPSGDDVWIYWGADTERFQSYQKTGKQRFSSLYMAKFKRDRFAGWESQNAAGAELETSLLASAPDRMSLNADASGGEIVAELCDESGRPLRGFTRADAETIRGDHLAAPILWKGGTAVTARQKVVMRLIVSGRARLYALAL